MSYLEYKQTDFRSYLSTKNLDVKDDGRGQWCIRVCPFCHPTGGKRDNEWKLYIVQSSGAYRCNRCQAQGSCYDFMKNMGDISPSSRSSKPRTYVKPDAALYRQAAQKLAITGDPVLAYLASRGISKATAEKFSLGADARNFQEYKDGPWIAENCVMLPYFDFDSKGNLQLIRAKLRSITNKHNMRFEPSGGASGFFGWQHYVKGCREIVITEGEFDAMVVWQQTNLFAVSLPHGNTLPHELVAKLEGIERIYLWFDDDIAGRTGLEKAIPMLGIERCWIVKTRGGADEGPKDANDAFRAGIDLTQLLATAQPQPHSEIVKPSLYKEAAIDQLLHPDKYLGLAIPSFPRLTKILGGIRDCEMTIVTGPTGFGKTSWVRQMVILMLEHHWTPTLFFSFEIRNEKLIADCANQIVNRHAGMGAEDFGAAIEELNDYPLYLSKFWGSTNVDEVIKAATYCVKVNGVKIIVIDNLQFMLSVQAKGANKFDLQDEAIHKLRIFVNQFRVHLFLISHPKKWGHGEALDMSAIFGTAKLTQDSDNVILMQPGSNGEQYIEVQKNRWCGRKGKVSYEFDAVTQTIQEVDDPVVVESSKFAKKRKPAMSWAGAADKAAGPDR